jgi:hypothetical protein
MYTNYLFWGYTLFFKLSQSAVLTDWESSGCYALASGVVASVFLAACL